MMCSLVRGWVGSQEVTGRAWLEESALGPPWDRANPSPGKVLRVLLSLKLALGFCIVMRLRPGAFCMEAPPLVGLGS